MNPILVVMAKEPEVGSTKTRLCPPLSLTEAARLYEALLLDTLSLCSNLEGIDLAIAVTPPESKEYFYKIRPQNALILPVACEDIGACLKKVLGELIKQGYPKVLALNSDGPTLPPENIYRAVKLLDESDLVLGPGEDGGYYLIGVKQLHENIFNHIEWSTPRVLAQSLARAEDAGLSTTLLPYWYDVDTADDIQRLQEEIDLISPDRLIHTRRYLLETPTILGTR